MATGVDVEVYAEPLAALRGVLDGADEALLGVAFVQQRGVNLLERRLATLTVGRLVTTTVFGSTTIQGLETADARGLRVRVLNPARGTFHPKLYLARHGDRLTAAIGSAKPDQRIGCQCSLSSRSPEGWTTDDRRAGASRRPPRLVARSSLCERWPGHAINAQPAHAFTRGSGGRATYRKHRSFVY